MNSHNSHSHIEEDFKESLENAYKKGLDIIYSISDKTQEQKNNAVKALRDKLTLMYKYNKDYVRIHPYKKLNNPINYEYDLFDNEIKDTCAIIIECKYANILINKLRSILNTISRNKAIVLPEYIDSQLRSDLGNSFEGYQFKLDIPAKFNNFPAIIKYYIVSSDEFGIELLTSAQQTQQPDDDFELVENKNPNKTVNINRNNLCINIISDPECTMEKINTMSRINR
jgi:hypothetical protein